MRPSTPLVCCFDPEAFPASILNSPRAFAHSLSKRRLSLAILAGLCALPAAQAQTAQFGYTSSQVAGFSGQGVTTITADASGNVYIGVENLNGGPSAVYKETPNSSGGYDQSTVDTGFTDPVGLAVDTSGDVLVADSGAVAGGGGIYVETPKGNSYSKSTLTFGFQSIDGMALDSLGNVYATDFATGDVYIMTLANNYMPAIFASGFTHLDGVATDTSGDIYILADSSIYKFTPGSGGYTQSTITSSLYQPAGLAVDGAGNVYTLDLHYGTLDKETLDSGSYTQSQIPGFDGDYGVALDGKGNLYVLSNFSVNKVQTAGVLFPTEPVKTASAALPLTFNFTNSTAATINAPVALTLGVPNLDFAVASGGSCNTTTQYGTGATASCTVNVTFTPTAPGLRQGAVELLNHSNAVIATAYVYGTGTGPTADFPPGTITTVAGNGTPSFSNGSSAITAELDNPSSVALDGAGNFYLADTKNNRIREVSPSGSITTVAGTGTAHFSGDNGLATSAELSGPSGVAVDGAGNIYIADTGNSRIREVNASTGIITTVAGTGSATYGGDGGAATSADLNLPYGVAVDGARDIYIADSYNNRVREVNAATGVITTVAGNGVSNFNGDNGSATSAELNVPASVALDSSGNMYIADAFNNRIREVNTSGVITTVAGDGVASYNGDNIPAVSAELYTPAGVAVDAAGNIYIADTYNNRIREVNVSGAITTVAGNGTGNFGGDNGPATGAELATPAGVALDSAGNLYIADYQNDRIRRVDVSDAPSLNFAATDIAATSSGGPQTITLGNIGNMNLDVETVGINSNWSLGSQTGACTAGLTIIPDASCTFDVSFTPQQIGPSLSGYLTVTDNSLNASPAEQLISLGGTVISVLPTVTGLLPRAGSPAGGSVVTITGTNFTESTSVTFGGAPAASVTVDSPTQITATSPSGILGFTVDVVATTPAGSSQLNSADQFQYVLPLIAIPTGTVTLTAGTPVQFIPVSASNGVPGYSYALTSGTLPSGLSFDTGTGAVSGTPTALVTNASYTVTVTDSAGEVAAQNFTLTVNSPNYVVSTNADNTTGSCTPLSSTTSNTTDTNCTLRAALNEASTAGSANIYFDTSVFAATNTPAANTIALSNGTLSIPSNTAIYGAASGSGSTLTNLVTVSGNNASSVFTVMSGVTSAAIANLAITGGNSGGFGGGISNSGALTVTNSTVSKNSSIAGAGIYNASGASLTVTGSTISGNTTAGGGGAGIYNHGTLTVTDSTISGNSASGVQPAGGGIYSSNGFTLADSTVTGNSVSCVAFGCDAGGIPASVFGGGISTNTGSSMISNSIVAANSGYAVSPGAAVNADVDGNFTDNGGNLIGTSSNGTSNLDPMLAPLANYGGPTQTMIPLPGSPAICAGSASNAATAGIAAGQRGTILNLTTANAATYTGAGGYCPAGFLDAGSVQTDYALSFNPRPGTVAAITVMSPAPAVVLDESGTAAVFTSGSTVTITDADSYLTNNSTASVTLASGVATFSNLLFTTPVASDSLKASLPLNPGTAPATAISITSGTFEVTQATPALSFTPLPASQTYGTAIASGSLNATASYNNASIAGTFAYTTTVNSSIVTLTAGATVLPAGMYTIKATFSPTSSLYQSTSVTASYMVNQAVPVITWATPANIVYGTGLTPGQLNATASVQGTFSYSPAAGAVLGAGMHTLSVGFTPSDTNDYSTPAPVTVSLTVTAAPLTIVVNDAARAYGAANPAFSGSPNGLVNGDSASSIGLAYSTTATPSSTVGNYAITASITSANYVPAITQGTLTVTGAALTVTANNATKIYGTENPSFSGSVTGQQNMDTFSESFSTTATASSPAGSYAIVPGVTGANLGDYVVNATDGTLAVTQAASSLTLQEGASSITPVQGLMLTATVADATTNSTGTPTGSVIFLNGPALLGTAPLSGGMASLTLPAGTLNPGAVSSLTAIYEGDTNFTASSASAPVSVTVAPMDFTLTPANTNLDVVPGGTVTTSFSITPLYGAFAGAVSFAVSGLPVGATASFSQTNLVAATSTATTVTLTIVAQSPIVRNDNRNPWRPVAPVVLGLLLMPFAAMRRLRRSALLRTTLFVLLGASAFGAITGCGSRNGFNAMPQHNYAVTVIATSGSISHSFPINLNVQ